MRRVFVLLLTLALPATAQAQWGAAPQAGYIKFADGTALRGMPVGGMDLTREFGGIFSVGVTFDYARGEIDGSKFPPAQLDFGIDSTVYAIIHQPVSVLTYGVRGEAALGSGRLQPYVGAGAGAYTLYLNAQQWDEPRTRSGYQLAVGGGIRFRTSESASVVVDARDVLFLNFDPNDLNVVREDRRNTRFPELNPPELEETSAHNVRFTVGFQFRPGRGR